MEDYQRLAAMYCLPPAMYMINAPVALEGSAISASIWPLALSETHKCGSTIVDLQDRHIESRHEVRWIIVPHLHDDHDRLRYRCPAAKWPSQSFMDVDVSIPPIQWERRGSTLERIKGATAGGIVGGSAAAIATVMAVGSIYRPSRRIAWRSCTGVLGYPGKI